jgi:hypothetical protein
MVYTTVLPPSAIYCGTSHLHPGMYRDHLKSIHTMPYPQKTGIYRGARTGQNSIYHGIQQPYNGIYHDIYQRIGIYHGTTTGPCFRQIVYTMVYTIVLWCIPWHIPILRYIPWYIQFSVSFLWLLHTNLQQFPGGHATQASKFMFSTVPDCGGTQDNMPDWSARDWEDYSYVPLGRGAG